MKRYDLEKFTYDEYLKQQKYRAERKWGLKSISVDINKKKLLDVWKKIKKLFKDNVSVCCMGIKSGKCDFNIFRELLPKSQIIGIDISEKVKEVDGETYCMDFNELPKEWKNRFNLVFSNSIDHSFNVKETIKEWLRITKKNGYLLLILSKAEVGYADLYQFNIKDIKKLFPNQETKLLADWENEFCVLVRKK